MCAIMSWGAHEYFMHPIFVLKNGCDKATPQFPICTFTFCSLLELGKATLEGLTP
jgi:hypothetical protein